MSVIAKSRRSVPDSISSSTAELKFSTPPSVRRVGGSSDWVAFRDASRSIKSELPGWKRSETLQARTLREKLSITA